MEVKECQIVVQVGSPPQFFGIKPLLELFKKKGIEFLCFTPVRDDEYSKVMFDQTYGLVKNSGFPVARNIDGMKTKIFLAAWPSANIEYKYLLRYTYSLLSAKPNPVYLPESQRHYHGILTQNSFEFEMLKVYSNTYFVSNLKYMGWKKGKTSGKTIIYLPTWNAASLGEAGEINSNEEIIPALKKLKKAGYSVVIKAHPLTLSDPSTRENARSLKRYADEYYESDTPIQDLLMKSDLVISDNSGAIYEALYTDTPVVVYGDKTEKRKLGQILPMHHRLIQEKIIDNPRRPEDILESVRKGLSREYAQKQINIGDELFKKDYTNAAVDGWLDVIKKYLSDDVNQDYIALHNYYNEYVDSTNNENTALLNKQSEYEMIIAHERNPGIKIASRQLVKSIHRRLRAKK